MAELFVSVLKNK